MRIAIIGTGRMGFTQAHIARAMHDEILWAVDSSAEARVHFNDCFHVQTFDNVASPHYSDVDLLWLTVKDSDISTVAHSLPDALPDSLVVLHTSGALSSDCLKHYLPHQSCASFHPLMTCPLCDVSDRACVDAYHGVVHAAEGDPSALEICKILTDRLCGKFVVIDPEKKILYHAAAVFSANYPTVLIDISANLFQACGFPSELALSSATSMCRQLLSSLDVSSPVDALTGPIKRRDFDTVRAHLSALQNYPDEKQVYEVLRDACVRMLHFS